jgi:hypothetical protein
VPPRWRDLAPIVALVLATSVTAVAQHPTPPPATAPAAAPHVAAPGDKTRSPASDHLTAPAASAPAGASAPAAPPASSAPRKGTPASDLKDAVARIQKRLDAEVGTGEAAPKTAAAQRPAGATSRAATPPRSLSPGTPAPRLAALRIALTWRTALVWPDELTATPAPAPSPRTSERITLIWR